MRSYWSLKLSEVVLVSLLFFYGNTFGQFSPDKTVLPGNAESNYLFPIKPGFTSIITGTMGELRNTHFHAGLDIDTPGVGFPVLSVQDGYISRVTCTTSGYGNVLYVTHPDGNTTLYAHLDEFKGAVGDWVRRERYSRKVSEIDLQFSQHQFPVSRGDLIALSKKDGKELWKYKTENGIFTDPVVFKGLVTVGESQGSLVFIDMLTGIKKGSFEPGRGVFSKPSINPDQKSVYFISGEGNAYSVLAESSTKSSIYYLK